RYRRTRCADVGDLSPVPLPHVQFGVVEAERLDLDHCVAVLWFGLWDLPDDQHLRPTKCRPENRSHEKSSLDPLSRQWCELMSKVIVLRSNATICGARPGGRGPGDGRSTT